MILKPNELDFSKKKIKAIIYGVPSIGKTTLGLSAPNPLLVDLDKGISRVESRYRKDVLLAETFKELTNDLKTSNLAKYETIVVDTGGALLDILKPYVILQEPKNSTKTGDLALAGWGAIAREFKQFSEFVNGLNKHIVYVFHANEDKDNDIVKYRLSAEGSTKTRIWEGIDLGGFIEMTGKKRTINFSASERFFAKGNHEINGTYEIPTLTEGVENNFLTKLFDNYLKKLAETTKVEIVNNDAYNRIMAFADVINSAGTLVALNEAYSGLKALRHVLTTKQELWAILSNRAKDLGLTFDKKQDVFIAQ